jgi:hypothetical protein
MVETAKLGEGMGTTVIKSESEIREILGIACGSRELLILVTPYMRFETNFLLLEKDAFQARVTMSAEEATYGLRSPDLHIRFPHNTRFLDARTKLLGFGLMDGRRTLQLAIPKTLHDDELRRAYRVERLGRVTVSFSTRKFDLRAGTLVNISTSGARIHSGQDSLEALLKAGDSISVSIPLLDGILINSDAVVRWTQGRLMGVEFEPVLGTDMLASLSRWVFQRREEDKDRVGAMPAETFPKSGTGPSMVLVSSSQEMEDTLRELLTDLPPITRVGPSVPAVKEAVAASPSLLFFHISDAGLDGRRRLKLLLEVAGSRIPIVLLGTQIENSVLFDLGNEHKAAAVYDLGARPGPFFSRLVQGILRRRQGEDSSKEG